MPPLATQPPAVEEPTRFIAISPTVEEYLRPEAWVLLQGRKELFVIRREGPVAPNSYFLWDIYSGGRQYPLRRPLEISLTHLEKGFLFTSEEFNVSGYGENTEEALADFSDFFIEDYTNLRDTPENELSQGARRLLGDYVGILGRANGNP
ncbi:MAG: hypothetical protein HY922_11315 [Elusimicrobia bacterium]|nr:hypothetical protein [Elusimicrobiota bacterium]